MRWISKVLLLLLPLAMGLGSRSLLARDAKGRFVVVIDAGHGGRDSGAVGRKTKEKTINLNVALKVGEYLKAQDPSIVVYYTRTKDVFIGLNERADFANKKKADLFVSIHTNSAGLKNAKAKGTETYVLGLARSEENLAVAMKENAAILKEDNYTQKYEGFDPNSTESYIIFELMQNKYLHNSLELAEGVHKRLVGQGLRNRGVRQAGFLVLRRTAMPSILIELGFITNPSDEEYMASPSGVSALGKSIANAIVAYASKIQQRNGASAALSTARVSGPEPNVEPATAVEESSAQVDEGRASAAEERATVGKVTYRIQVYAGDRRVKNTSKTFKGYQQHLKYYKEGGVYKYTLYDVESLEEAKRLRRQLDKTFKGCFVVKFVDGKKA